MTDFDYVNRHVYLTCVHSSRVIQCTEHHSVLQKEPLVLMVCIPEFSNPAGCVGGCFPFPATLMFFFLSVVQASVA